MPKTIEDYLGLITSWHRGRPRFEATVQKLVEPLISLQEMLEKMPSDFDLDLAVGPQLDVVGEWIGRSRLIPTPIPHLWFTWGDDKRGWGKGIWLGPYDTETGLTRLDDETYRQLLRAKIAVNNWDGTVPGAQAALDTFFNEQNAPGALVFIDDKGDMSQVVGVSGKIPDVVPLVLLAEGYLPLNPAGTKTYHLVTSINQTPLFGWGVENEYVSGWGTGTWGITPQYLAEFGTSSGAYVPLPPSIVGLALSDGWLAAYDPSEVSASDLRTSGSDSFVTTLRDGLGNLPNLAQATTANQPKFIQSGLGELDVCEMTNDTNSLDATFVANLDQPNTLMVVAQCDGPFAAAYRTIIDTPSTGLGRQALQYRNTAGNPIGLFATADCIGVIGISDQPRVLCGIFNGPDSLIWVDGSLASGIDDPGPSTMGGLRLGRTATGLSSWFPGRWGPALVYDGPIPDDARRRMTKLLMTKADLTNVPYIPAVHAVAVNMNGDVLYEKGNANTAVLIQSITKVVTFLVARDYITDGMLDTLISPAVDATDLSGTAGSTANLLVGDIFSYRDLFHGMMLPSGNDATNTLAIRVGAMIPGGGASITKFLAAMNAKADSLGAVDMNFVNSHGNASNTGSALSCCKVMRALLNDAFARSVMHTSQHLMTVTGANARTYTVDHSIEWETGDTTGDVPLPEYVAAKTGSGTNFFNMTHVYEYGGEEIIVTGLHSPNNLGRFLSNRNIQEHLILRDHITFDTVVEEPVDPTLALDLLFAENSSLLDEISNSTSIVTATRTSQAKIYSSNGTLRNGPHNLYPHTEDFTQAAWTKGVNTTLGSIVTGPDGIVGRTLTAANASDPSFYESFVGTLGVGKVLTLSVWAKKSASGAPTHFGFTINNGANWTGALRVKHALTDYWQRFTYTFTTFAANHNVAFFDARTAAGAVDPDCIGSVDLAGPMLEENPSVGPYLKNSTASFIYGPRFDHHPVTYEPRGLLWEPQKPNNFLYSEDFTQAQWVKTLSTITVNAAVAPNGTTTASKLVASAGLGTHRVHQNPSMAGSSVWCFSVYAKAAGWSYLNLRLSHTDGSTRYGHFNLTTGTLGTVAAGLRATMEDVGNGWYRCSISWDTVLQNTGTHSIVINTTNIDNTPNDTGDGVSGIYIWGAQAESGPSPTSYIPTTTVAVTRAADVLSVTDMNFSDFWNPAEGTLVLDYESGGATGHLLNVNNGTQLERMLMSAEGLGQIIDGNVLQASMDGGVPVGLGSTDKLALAYKLNDGAVALNGGAAVVDTSCTIPTVDRLFLDAGVVGTDAPLYPVWNKRLRYYNVRKPQNELQSLTND
jgi:hypothetical protein